MAIQSQKRGGVGQDTQEPVAKHIMRTAEKVVQDWTYTEKSNTKYHKTVSHKENGGGWRQISCGKEIHMQRQRRMHWRLANHYGLCHGANVKVNVIKHWYSCVGRYLMITDVHIHFYIGEGPISWYKQNVNNLYFTY
jgi:hypothetical protein